MTQEIMSVLHAEQLKEEDRMHLLSYLKGETDILKLPRMKHRC